MAIELNPEQRALGEANFQRTAEGLKREGAQPNRRDFMKSLAITGGVVVPVSAATYFGYQIIKGKPVKVAVIGTGDEGNVLIGALNPEAVQVTAICDIRPYNIKRAFDGEKGVPVRPGLKSVYGGDTASIKVYDDYKKMLAEQKDIEAVIIALPLHLHAPVTIDCLRAGKHVLCEKLMAWNVTQCKEMITAAKEANRILSIGHQRHYSLLYAHAAEVMQAGVLGDVKHIRALWHRNNSWPYEAKAGEPIAPGYTEPVYRDGWCNPIFQVDHDKLAANIKQHGYKSMEELVRWRLYNRTGGGLMAELGSHQLDACSIFLGKVHPLAVTGVGGKFFYGPGRNDRDCEDIVTTTFEFPGRNHPKGANKGTDTSDIVIVTYSSMSTNQFEAYGECVMGSRGTMVVEGEKSVMLYTEKQPGKAGEPKAMAVGVTAGSGNKPTLDTTSTWGPPQAAQAVSGGAAGGGAPLSRGYREEIEDFAYCIRQWNEGMEKDRRLPRCHGKVAMADAILALSANLAMRTHQRIEFQESWFDPENPAVPDADMKPEVI